MAPKAPDPTLCTDPAKMPPRPANASIVQPVDPEEQAATEAFLNWVGLVVDWGKQGQDRAALAQKDCLSRQP